MPTTASKKVSFTDDAPPRVQRSVSTVSRTSSSTPRSPRKFQSKVKMPPKPPTRSEGEEQRLLFIGVCLRQIANDCYSKLERTLDEDMIFVNSTVLRIHYELCQNAICGQILKHIRYAGETTYKVEMIDWKTYECRLFVDEFIFPKMFKIYSGINDRIPLGFLCYKLNEKDLTAEERITCKSVWTRLLNKDGYFSSKKVIDQVYKGLVDAVESSDLADLVIDLSKDQRGFIKLQVVNIKFRREYELRVIVSIRGNKVQKGMKIQHALPRQIPYSNIGKKHLKRIETEIEDGQYIWYADTTQPSRKSFEKYIKPGIKDSCWELCCNPLLDELIDDTEELGLQFKIKGYIKALTLLKSKFPRLQGISFRIFLTLAMWQVKKHGAEWRALNSDQAPEAFSKMLSISSNALKKGSCPDFLSPNLNKLSGHEPDFLVNAGECLGTILNDLETRPRQLMRTLGCQKRRLTLFDDVHETVSSDEEEESNNNSLTTSSSMKEDSTSSSGSVVPNKDGLKDNGDFEESTVESDDVFDT